MKRVHGSYPVMIKIEIRSESAPANNMLTVSCDRQKGQTT